MAHWPHRIAGTPLCSTHHPAGEKRCSASVPLRLGFACGSKTKLSLLPAAVPFELVPGERSTLAPGLQVALGSELQQLLRIDLPARDVHRAARSPGRTADLPACLLCALGLLLLYSDKDGKGA